MKKAIISIIIVAMTAAPALAARMASVTFAIVSSAKTATPNVRIGQLRGLMATDGSSPMQIFAPTSAVNYYLTKSTTYTFPQLLSAYLVQVDQDTKMYFGSDLTNFIILPSGGSYIFGVK